MNKAITTVITKKSTLYNNAKFIIENARSNAIHSVDFERVKMYWKLGELIVQNKQPGKFKAIYGDRVIVLLSNKLQLQFGSGFSKENLHRSIKFYKTYRIVSELRTQLNWYQYRTLIHIDKHDKRAFYEYECVQNAWNGQELERQINSNLYERLLLSNNKKTLLQIANKQRLPQSASEIVKDPIYLEFLGLPQKSSYQESDLELAIINHLQEFLMELGNGFAFVARQKRIQIQDDEFFVDLVFYNYLLKCFVIIDLKIDRITHQDLGQLQMYVNYYDRKIKLENDQNTIGILLCSKKNNELVKITLPENSNILASEYKMRIPSTRKFIAEMKKVKLVINK